MKFGIRKRLLIAMVVCYLPVVAISLSGLAGWLTALVAVVCAAVSAFAVYSLLEPIERLRRAAAEAGLQAPQWVGEQALVIDAQKDEAGQIGQTLWALLDRLTHRHTALRERDSQYQDAITLMQNSLTAIGSAGKTPVPAVQIASPWPRHNQALANTVAQLASQTTLIHRRAQVYLAIINDMPDAVMVCDEKLDLVLTNTAANKLLIAIESKATKRLCDLFVETPGLQSNDPDVPPTVGAEQVREIVQQSRTSQFVAMAKDSCNTPISFRVLPASQRNHKGIRVLLARDASSEISTQLESRQRHRRDVGLRMCMLVNKEAGSTLESIRTQASLLTQAAKQAGQREKFLPKINRLLDDLSKQEAIVNLLGWLGRLNQTNASLPDMAEVRLRDLIENTADQLKGLFAERSNSIDIQGDAGWIVADEEWISVMLTGMMLHANHSVQQAAIRCSMRRRTGSDTRLRAECSEIQVFYKGEALSTELLADIHDPFGRMNSSALAPASSRGFPLGLAVAARVARLMGGEIYSDVEEGLVQLRVLIPTREKSTQPMTRSMPVREDEPEVDLSETLGGWEIGGAKQVSEAEDSSDNASQPTLAIASEEPIVSDETVGGWFGGMRE